MSENMVEVKNLKKYFNVGKGKELKAVDGVSLFIRKGETLGLVGESGCGKSTLGKTIMKFYEPTEGQILFQDRDITKLSRRGYLNFTKEAQMIFQDPYASLDSRMTAGSIISEGMDIHKICSSKSERQERVYELLNLVGLNKEHANRFAHEFSGGQRQRIGIARALALNPEFIVCDEPISALDVSIQAQVINLLLKLQGELNLTYLFIAHDLSVVKHISDRVAVMYLGAIMEVSDSHNFYMNPLHPYTEALLSAIPIPNPDVTRAKKRILLEGDVPSPVNPKPGCKFASRCKLAKPSCFEKAPELKEVEPGHFVACHMVSGE
ncbi:ABC transporter ATP-binding protein [Lacrimispora sp. NSJ-141]|uniref:ABC transporter ATP-binding protein n=1 Tax=Lientehia hominis TaxID=2897778 RepID=A0AAP2RFB8_9FIRM|nr:ABC transporter ATP-binding protein [Lientehia hominis]MCD2491159.1 ABC transporter ATP-binding protein [Lientehia hominis]